MATKTVEAAPSDLVILGRLLENGGMRPALARELLKVHFSESDQERMHQLAQKNQMGKLTRREKDELFGYVRAGDWLMWMQSRARIALKRKSPRGSNG